MQTLDAVKKRRSIRNFDPDKSITDKQIDTLLEAARLAPSAGNLQSRYFVFTTDPKIKEKLAESAHNQDFVSAAPLVIVSCADLKRSSSKYGERGSSLYAIQDATIATQNIWLAATDIGLATTWVGAFDEKSVAKILDLPDHLRPIAILPIGYPAESPAPTPRQKIKEISKRI